MSYTSKEQSAEDGSPVELYRFSNQEQVFTYTSGPSDVVYNSETYTPISIGRSELLRKDADSSRSMEIEVVASNAVVQRYVATVPATVDEFQLFKFHTTDGGSPEVVKLFKGKITNVEFKGSKATVHARNSGSSLLSKVPQQTTRNACNFILYGGKCGVDAGQFFMSVTVTALSADGLTVTVDGSTNTILNTGLQLSAQLTSDSTFFDGGKISRGSFEPRMVRVATNPGGNISAITVLFPFQELTVGTAMNLFAGCRLSYPICGTRFDNKIRYGGFPFVPNKNPHDVGVKGN